MTLESRSITPVEKPIFPLEGLEIRGLSGYKNGCGAERLSLPQPRLAPGFSWQSSPAAVCVITRDSGDAQRSNSPSEKLTRHLTILERQSLWRALRRSVRIVAKGRRLTDLGRTTLKDMNHE